MILHDLLKLNDFCKDKINGALVFTGADVLICVS